MRAVRAYVEGVTEGFRLLASDARRTSAAVRATWAEALLVASYVGGWALLTWGMARLLVPEVWLLSAGLLLITFGGWRSFRTLAAAGFYHVVRDGER